MTPKDAPIIRAPAAFTIELSSPSISTPGPNSTAERMLPLLTSDWKPCSPNTPLLLADETTTPAVIVQLSSGRSKTIAEIGVREDIGGLEMGHGHVELLLSIEAEHRVSAPAVASVFGKPFRNTKVALRKASAGSRDRGEFRPGTPASATVPANKRVGG